MAGILVGFVLRIIGSLVAWIVTARYLTPKIKIRDTIEPTQGTDSAVNYVFAIRNARMFRDALDVSIRVRCRLRWTQPPGSYGGELLDVFNIPTDEDWIPLVRSRWHWRKSWRQMGASWVQYPATAVDLIASRASEALELPKDERGNVDLPHIITELEGSSITLVIIAYDSWSGTKGVFIKYFTRDNIA